MKRKPIVRFAQDKKGQYYWRLQAANHRIVAVGTNTHRSLTKAMFEVQRLATSRGLHRWEPYEDKRGKWRWRAVHPRTKDVVAGSYEAFSSEHVAVSAIQVPYRILAEYEGGKVRSHPPD